MSRYALGEPARQFMFAALQLTAEDWDDVATRRRGLGDASRRAMQAVEDALSAAERSSFERQISELFRSRPNNVLDTLSLRLGGVSYIALDNAVFALQKQGKLADEVLRLCFDPFENVGISLDALLDGFIGDFPHFDAHAPIADATIAAFEPLAPIGAVQMWRTWGAGRCGDDGFVRIVDPQRATEMLDGVIPLQEGAVPMFLTGMADVIVFSRGLFLLFTLRDGTIHLIPPDVDLNGLVRLLTDDALLDSLFGRAPYREAAARDGVPAFEDCYGYVPLLALGGHPASTNLQLMGTYEHMEVVRDLAGPPQVVGPLYDPSGHATG